MGFGRENRARSGEVLWGSIAQVYGREQASRTWVTRESMEEDDMVMR